MIENQEHSEIVVGSDRSFGIVFAVVFSIIGLLPLLAAGSIRIWALLVAAGFLAIALIIPRLLSPLNRLWFKLGMLLAKVVNPIVMLLIYIIAMVPIGLILRASGKDLLRQRLDPNVKSYWISRDPPGPEPESLTDQF